MMNESPIIKMHGQYDPDTSLSDETTGLQIVCERNHVRQVKSTLKEMEWNLL